MNVSCFFSFDFVFLSLSDLHSFLLFLPLYWLRSASKGEKISSRLYRVISSSQMLLQLLIAFKKWQIREEDWGGESRTNLLTDWERKPVPSSCESVTLFSLDSSLDSCLDSRKETWESSSCENENGRKTWLLMTLFRYSLFFKRHSVWGCYVDTWCVCIRQVPGHLTLVVSHQKRRKKWCWRVLRIMFMLRRETKSVMQSSSFFDSSWIPSPTTTSSVTKAGKRRYFYPGSYYL